MKSAPLAFVALAVLSGRVAFGQATEARPLRAAATPFAEGVAPFLAANCTHCHGGREPEAELALDQYQQTANVQEDAEVWERVLRVLNDRLMPPADEPQPDEGEIQAAISAIESELAAFDCGNQSHPGRVTIRRLNRAEYNNTIRDLVGIDFRPADDFPSDDVGEGFDNIGDVLSMPPLLLEKYLRAAEEIVTRAAEDGRAASRILADQTVGDPDSTRRRLELFASRAFRRPVNAEETDRLLGLMKFVQDNGGSRLEAYQAALQAVLVSPHFLFRVEIDPEPDDEDGIRELNDYELATRLSYFLWSSMPDDRLQRAAAKGELRDPSALELQVKRMLADEKAKALVENFAGQWLQLRDLPNLTPDREKFPNFDEELRAAMQRETELFFEAIIREDRSVLDLLAADFSYVNRRLAQHYGMDGIEGEHFRRVGLDKRRRGVLTHGSILLLTSNPTRTSPVKRGKWILDNILGEPPPPPPEGIEELSEDAEVLGSLRERLEQHRSNESCAVCHRRMDPIGFGLENFDAVGAWRDYDGPFEIDASGTLLGGRTFAGPDELIGILIEQKREEFCRCLTRKMLTYALGRGLSTYDRCAVDEILRRLGESEFRFSALVTAIVTSAPFRMRARGAE